MTKQEMIERIYEQIADKKLNFGCRIATNFYHSCTPAMFNPDGHDMAIELAEVVIDCRTEMLPTSIKDKINIKTICNEYEDIENIKGEYIIIGHPVMIGDVLDWHPDTHKIFRDKRNFAALFYKTIVCNLMKLREHKRLPIDQQSEECIKYVYDLLPKTNDTKTM